MDAATNGRLPSEKVPAALSVLGADVAEPLVSEALQA
jgi:hypothetical protein